MPLTSNPANVPTGVTPKVAKIHWDDLEKLFKLKITFMLVTPLGVFPSQEFTFDFADLASAIQEILTLWALSTTGDVGAGGYITAPAGDLTVLGNPGPGMAARLYQEQINPPGFVDDATAPDVVPDYNGVTDSWGQTTP